MFTCFTMVHVNNAKTQWLIYAHIQYVILMFFFIKLGFTLSLLTIYFSLLTTAIILASTYTCSYVWSINDISGIDSELICSRLWKASQLYNPDSQILWYNKNLKKEIKKKKNYVFVSFGVLTYISCTNIVLNPFYSTVYAIIQRLFNNLWEMPQKRLMGRLVFVIFFHTTNICISHTSGQLFGIWCNSGHTP